MPRLSREDRTVSQLRESRRWLSASIASAFLFGVLLTLDRLHVTRPIDGAVSGWLETHDPERFDPIAKTIGLAGHSAVIGVVTLGLAIFLWRRGPRLGWLAPFAVGLTGVAEIVAKLPLLSPPTPVEYLQAAADALAGLEVGTSFPSGHVARVVCLAVLAGSLSRRPGWRPGMVAGVGLIFLARTYAGGHTVSDTIGGLVLGLSAGSLSVAWLKWRQAIPPPGRRAAYRGDTIAPLRDPSG